MLRLVATILPIALLAACGGGGGGGAAAPVTPVTPPPVTPPPVALETPPDFRIEASQLESARMLVEGSLPDSPPSQSDLETQVVRIAQGSDALLFSEIATGAINASRMITCTPGATMCDAEIDMGDGSNIVMQKQAPEDIEGPVLSNDGEGFAGYNDQFAIVMTDEGVPLVQASAAGRLEGVRYEYQGYGGWLDHSVFVIQYRSAMVGSEEVAVHSAYSFGNASGKNPTRNATWDGVMVGIEKDGGDIVQGRATVQWDTGTLNSVGVFFTGIKNLTEGRDADTTLMTWANVNLMNGAFSSVNDSTTGSIWGNFYGDGDEPEEAGGIFDRDGIIGAFGGKR